MSLRKAGLLGRELATEYVIATSSGFSELDVERDGELERLECARDLALIWERNNRVAAYAHERLDLPLAGREDLVGEDIDWHLAHELAEFAKPRARSVAPDLARRPDFCMAIARRHEHTGIRNRVACSVSFGNTVWPGVMPSPISRPLEMCWPLPRTTAMFACLTLAPVR